MADLIFWLIVGGIFIVAALLCGAFFLGVTTQAKRTHAAVDRARVCEAQRRIVRHQARSLADTVHEGVEQMRGGRQWRTR